MAQNPYGNLGDLINQLFGFIEPIEGFGDPPGQLYDDEVKSSRYGPGHNPTIGYGLNIRALPSLELVLGALTGTGAVIVNNTLLTYSGNVFQVASQIGAAQYAYQLSSGAATITPPPTSSAIANYFEWLVSLYYGTGPQATTNFQTLLTYLNNALAAFFSGNAPNLSASGSYALPPAAGSYTIPAGIQIPSIQFSTSQAETLLEQYVEGATIDGGLGGDIVVTGDSQLRSAQIYKQLPGNSPGGVVSLPGVSPESAQWLALLTTSYQGLTPSEAKKWASALAEGDMAQVWYDIRYKHADPLGNLNLGSGLAKRDYIEAQLFGLNGSLQNNLTQAMQDYEVLTENRKTIMAYEQKFGSDPDGQNPNASTNSIAIADGDIAQMGTTYQYHSPNATTPVALTGGVSTLAQTFSPEDSLVVGALETWYAGDPNVNAGVLTSIRSTDIFAAPSQSDIDYGFAAANQELVDAGIGDGTAAVDASDASATHLILGISGGDTLQGGKGNDVIVAGAGAETVVAGAGSDTILAGSGVNGQGNATLVEGQGNDIFDIDVTPSSSLVETIVAKGSDIGGVYYFEQGQGDVNLGGAPDNPLLAEAGSTNLWSADGSSNGVQYSFVASSGTALGTLKITGGGLGSNIIYIKNFNLQLASEGGPNYGFLGFYLQPTISLLSGTNTSTAGALNSGENELNEGALQTFTASLGAPNNSVQTISVALSGADALDFALNTGSNLIPFVDGTATINVPAGQDSVDLALVDLGDVTQNVNLQLVASLTGPDDQTVDSNPLNIAYLTGSPDPFVNPAVANQINPTAVYSSTGTLLYNQYQGDGANDSIATGAGPNVVVLGNGNDIVNDGSGGDIIGSGAATASGGNLPLIGQAGGNGNNVIILNGNADMVLAGGGNNRIYGTTENTDLTSAIADAKSGSATGTKGALLTAGDGDNTIVSSNGNDLIIVGTGNDMIVAGPGDDTILGGLDVTSAQTNWSTSETSQSGSSTLVTNNVEWTPGPYSASANYDGNIDGNTGAPFGLGDDTIFAGSGSDLINLSNGDNYVDLGTSNSSVFGGMGTNTIFGGAGNVSVYGGGGSDYINGESGNDTLIGNGGDNTIIGGTGNDTIFAGAAGADYATAETGDNYVEGGSGDDLIVGSGGNDTLIAGSGNTTIQGGDGNEYIYGGSGNDSLVAVGGNDTIEAGGAGNDTLGASAGDVTIFGGLGSDLIEGGSGTNLIYSGDGGTTQAATTVVAGSGDTTIYGGSGYNDLYGGSGNDVIYGGTGTALVEGGTGSDTLYAGDGDSVDVVADTGATTIYGGAGFDLLEDTLGGNDLIESGPGNDTLFGTGNDTLVAGAGDDLFEVDGGNGTIQIEGGFGDDSVSANSSTPNITFDTTFESTDFTESAVYDQNGNIDLLISGDGGSLLLSNALSGSFYNIVFDDPQSFTLAQFLQQATITDLGITSAGDGCFDLDVASGDSIGAGFSAESISAWGNDDTLSAGSENGAVVYAGGDANWVYGGSSNDTLAALGKNDTLVGGSGTNTFIVENASAVIQDQANSGADSVFASVSYTLPEAIEQLILTGSSNLVATGNDENDTLTAGGGRDTLVAGSGLATLVAGTGSDTFVVNNTADVISANTLGADAILSSVSYSLPVDVKALTLTGTADLSATGGSQAAVISGNSGNDTLTSISANDTLVAGGGNDTLIAGSGNDILEGGVGTTTFVLNNGFGQDTIESGAGDEIVQFGSGIIGSNFNISASLANSAPVLVISDGGSELLIEDGFGQSVQFELDGSTLSLNQLLLSTGVASTTVTGSSGNFILDTTNGTSVQGGVGADTIWATGNNDTLIAGSGSDRLLGLGVSDSLVGGTGNDTLVGLGGDDTLEGGSGNDSFVSNSSGNIIQESTTAAQNAVTASVNFTLPGGIDNLTLTGNEDLVGVGNADAQNLVIGNAGNDTLIAGAGKDTLVAGSGIDTLIGDAETTFVISNADDTVSEQIATANDTLVAGFSETLPTNVNTLILTGSANLYGAANGENDILVANSALDTLVAGSGIDTLVGGGKTIFEVNSSSDWLQETNSFADDTVLASSSYVLPTHIDTLILTVSGVVGSANNDAQAIIQDRAGNNTLIAGTGNDTLGDGNAADTMIGGGHTTFLVNNAGDVVQEQNSEAMDTAISAVSFSLESNVDTLSLTGSTLEGSGNSDAHNLIEDNGAGNSTLVAGSGADTLVSGNGSDTLVAGAGPDVLIVNNVQDVLQNLSTQDTIESSVEYSLSGVVNTLILVGNGGDVGTAGAGNDILIDKGGADELVAGSGIDTMIGDGSTAFVINNASDVVEDDTSNASDTIYASASFSLPSDVDNLVLIASGIVGYANNDASVTVEDYSGGNTLIAGTGLDTLIDGNSLDTLIGGGSTTFIVNEIGDVVEEQNSAANDTVEASIGYTLGTNVNNLVLTGSDIVGAGNAGNADIVDYGGNNTLVSGSGNDTINDQSGSDTLIAGAGDDLLSGISHDVFAINPGFSDDRISESSGLGVLILGSGIALSSLTATAVQSGDGDPSLLLTDSTGGSITIDNGFNEAIDQFQFVGSATLTLDQLLSQIQSRSSTILGASGNLVFNTQAGASLTGGVGNDTIVGVGVGDTLSAGSGNQELLGFNANDSVVGSSGSDVLYGGIGNDTVVAGTGNSTLVSGSGVNTLIGGSGNDVLVVNNTGDVLQSVTGQDTIESSVSYTLSAAVSTLVLVGSAAISATGNGDGDTIWGSQGNDTFIGGVGGAGDAMIGGGGDNIFIVNNVDDTVADLHGRDDTVLSSVNFSLPAGVDTLILAGSGNLTVTGNDDESNFIASNSGNDYLTTGSGNDTIALGSGEDTVVFDSFIGSDLVTGAGQSDLIEFGSGLSESDFTFSAIAGSGNSGPSLLISGDGGSITVVGGLVPGDAPNVSFGEGLISPFTLVAPNGAQTIASGNGEIIIDGANGGSITGSQGGDDTIIATGNNDTINAAADSGALIYAYGTADLVYGGAGSDVINASRGTQDTLFAGTGNDLVYGGGASSSIVGGVGVDTLYAGNGSGTTVVAGAGNTTIYGGTSSGSLDVIEGGTGADVLYSGNGGYSATEYTAVYTGSGPGTLYGGAGSELLDDLDGGENGNDLLVSGSGNNTLFGFGNDTLVAGSGDDYLYGSGNVKVAQNETYVFNAGFGDVTVSGPGHVQFGPGISPSQLSVSMYAPAPGVSSSLTGALVVSDSTGGAITIQNGLNPGVIKDFDFVDGSDLTLDQLVEEANATPVTYTNGSQIVFSASDGNSITLTSGGTIYAFGDDDTLQAGSGSNAIYAYGSDDVIYGGTGNRDQLIALGSGPDTFYGGQTASTYTVNNSADVIIQSNTSSGDVIDSSVNYSLPENVTVLYLTGSAALVATSNNQNDSISGNSAASTLIGGSGSDTLEGGNGNTLIAGTGPTTLFGPSGVTFVINSVNDVVQGQATVFTDTVESSISYTLPEFCNTLILTGSANLFGDAVWQGAEIVGNSGNDTLQGGNTLIGGTGNDVFVVYDDEQTVEVGATHGNDTAEAYGNYVLPENIQILVLESAYVGTGNDESDTIVATTINTTLVAGSGLATLIGAGDEVYVVNNSNDVIEDSIGGGTVLSSASFVLPTNINVLNLTGSANIDGTAVSGNNSITGNAGNDVLTAGSGSDTLVAGSGIDTLVGNGNTTFVIDNPNDVIELSTGSNEIESYVSYSLPSAVNQITFVGSANVVGQANSGNDTLVSNSGVDTFIGGSGNDVFVISNSSDVVEDTSTGSANVVQASVNYSLSVNVNSLILTGTSALSGTANSGNDTLTSNTGKDTFTGGSGNDTFVINNAQDVVQDSSTTSSNTIQASVSYTLSTDVNTLVLTGTAALKGTANNGNDTLVAGAGKDTLVGGSTSTSNDLFIVNSGNDSVSVGTTHGTDTIESSATWSLASTVTTLILESASIKGSATNSVNDTLIATGAGDTVVAGTTTTSNDLLEVTSSSDVITIGTTHGTDTIESAVNWTLTSSVTTLIINGASQSGGAYNGASDTLEATAAGDTLVAGNTTASSDLFVVDYSNDVVSIGATHGADTVESAATNYTLSNNATLLTLIGSVAISGTGNSLADTLTAGSGNDTLAAGTGIAKLVGGTGDDTFVINNTSDVVQDTTTNTSNVIDSSVSYTLVSNVNSLVLTGSSNLTGIGNSGVDLLLGNAGQDSLTDTVGSAALLGGTAKDTLTGGAHSDFYGAGTGGDSIVTGVADNVVAVNAGDGAVTIQPASGASDILSLGNGIDTEGLSFSKSGNNLILTDTQGDTVTFANWYAGSSDQNFVTLQVIEQASGSYKPNSGNSLQDEAVEQFNFSSLVSQFNTALANNPSLTSWSLSNGMPSAQLSGTNNGTQAYGGDLAYYDGLNGNLNGLNSAAGQNVLTNSAFGTGEQTIDAWSSISGGSGGQGTLVKRDVTASLTPTTTAATATASTTSTSYADLLGQATAARWASMNAELDRKLGISSEGSLAEEHDELTGATMALGQGDSSAANARGRNHHLNNVGKAA